MFAAFFSLALWTIGRVSASLKPRRHPLIMEISPLPRVTSNNNGLYIQKTSSIMAAAFEDDALERYVILVSDNLPNSTVIPRQRHLEHFTTSIAEKGKAGAIISESGDWGAAALWYPPGAEILFSDRESLVEPMQQLYDSFAEVKKRWLKGRAYWYLNLIARQPGRSDRGLIRALIDPFLQKAADQGVPAWLEATNKHSRDVYEHLGFREVDQIRIGAGQADQTGNLIAGGEGITIFCMIAEPNI